jgi:hypothetical protein
MRGQPLEMLGMAATFAVAFLVAMVVLPRLPLGPKGSPRLLTVPSFTVPRGSFFAETTGDEISQLVLWHALGDSIAHARRADILFIGDSRMPMGLRQADIVPAAGALGLRVFSLACGHVERVPFALKLIRKHDLRPKVVVVVGGPHLFRDVLSGPAEKAMKLTRWRAWTQWTEADARWRLQSWVHAWLPKIDWFGQRLTSSWILYRSTRTGWLIPVVEPSARYPIGFDREDASYAPSLPVARALKDELDRRGAALILSLVPYGDTRTGHLPFLARELGVPVVLPSFDGLATADGSHLDRSSAESYGKAFWSQLLALPEVREKLSLDDPAPKVGGVAARLGARLPESRNRGLRGLTR